MSSAYFSIAMWLVIISCLNDLLYLRMFGQLHKSESKKLVAFSNSVVIIAVLLVIVFDAVSFESFITITVLFLIRQIILKYSIVFKEKKLEAEEIYQTYLDDNFNVFFSSGVIKEFKPLFKALLLRSIKLIIFLGIVLVFAGSPTDGSLWSYLRLTLVVIMLYDAVFQYGYFKMLNFALSIHGYLLNKKTTVYEGGSAKLEKLLSRKILENGKDESYICKVGEIDVHVICVDDDSDIIDEVNEVKKNFTGDFTLVYLVSNVKRKYKGEDLYRFIYHNDNVIIFNVFNDLENGDLVFLTDVIFQLNRLNQVLCFKLKEI